MTARDTTPEREAEIRAWLPSHYTTAIDVSVYENFERHRDLLAMLDEARGVAMSLMTELGEPRSPDHACVGCAPGGPIVKPGFLCAFHKAKGWEK